jgi:carbon-monoxide dehydrogenase small subunit
MSEELEKSTVRIVVNGAAREHTVEPRLLLVDFLRTVLGLTGTHVGCDTSSCGACTVLLGNRCVKSCAVLAVQADGQAVTTVEGLAEPDGRLHALQRAFHEEHALQCGYCTPGMLMAAVDLLTHAPRPDERTIRRAIAGNICRCTGYQNIVKAIGRAAAELADGEVRGAS